MSEPGGGLSAAELAEQLGELPSAGSIPLESLELVERVRDLVEATVATDLSPADRADVADAVAALTARLRARPRVTSIVLVRHEDGRVENLSQAGSGRLNPQAPRLELDELPAPPPAGSEPVPVEIVARCTLTVAHGGPPGRAHGGIVAVLLDEALGVAAHAAGASGMTAAIDVRFRAATPYGVPLEITARFTERDGRKRFASGEIRVDGKVTAEATAVYIGGT